jgi:hypothetical protein
MKPLGRRKFISLPALSGAGLASLSAQDQCEKDTIAEKLRCTLGAL